MTSPNPSLHFHDIDLHKDHIYAVESELTEIVPQHTHAQGHILVVLEGVATLNVERSAYYIPNGYFVWIPSEVSHRVAFEGPSIKVLNLYYPAAFSQETFFQQVGMYPIPSLLYHTLEIIRKQAKSYLPDDWQYELLVTLHHILPHIVKRQKYPLRLPTTDHPLAQKIVEIIHTHYQQSVSAQSVSKEAGVSIRSLSRYLRTELDMSLVQYVRTYRIIMAIQLMVKGEDSITNIAYRVGFDSLTTFSNSFYKVTGMRPSLFLRQDE